MKKLFAIILLPILFLSGYFNAAAQNNTAPITLRIGGAGSFKLPGKNDTAPRYRADRAIVEAFERQHPNIRLESAQGLRIQGPAAEANLLLQFAAGSAPDVVYVNFRESATYIGQGFLEPLDNYLANDPGVGQRINPVIMNVLKDVGHGHIYSIPYAQFVQALYYRKDIFRAAGLDPDKPPTTWDEFYNDSKLLTDQDKGVWGFEFGTDPDAAGYWWVNFLWQAGGDVIQKNNKGEWQAAFNTPQGVEALSFYKKLMCDPWVAPNGKTYKGVATHSSNMGQDRSRGKVAMWFQYQSNVIANTADTTTLNPSLIGIAPMPKGPTGITANEINAAMWGISSQIKDPRIREAAWEFVRFMSSDEADRIRTKSYVEAGLGNTVNPESLYKYGYGDFTSPQSKSWLEANRTLFQHGKPEPYGENMNQIYVLLGTPLADIERDPKLDPKKLLDAAAKEVNSKLTGYVNPAEMTRRRIGALTGFILFALIAGTILMYQFRSVFGGLKKSLSAEQSQTAGASVKTHLVAWIFMIPAVITILLWMYYPLCRGLVMAFQDYRILGGSRFIGLDNFIDVFHQPTFWYGLRTSIWFTVYSLGLGFFLPIFLALGLSEIPKGKMLYRTMYYLPAVTSGLIIVFLWKWFEDSSPQGLFNAILHTASMGHIQPVKWLEDVNTALIATVLPRIWAAAGPGCIIYLAALKGVPEEMYEAADLDGAGIWTKIRHITLPTLKPLILINLVGATIGAFQASESMLVMTGGGPLYATHTLGLEIFYNAFLYLRFGYATAAAWIMGMLLIGFTLFQLRILKDLKFSTAKA